MAGRTGLEPATSAVTGQCSNQLNYRPLIKREDSSMGPKGDQDPTSPGLGPREKL
jgi:hypothetical protein